MFRVTLIWLLLLLVGLSPVACKKPSAEGESTAATEQPGAGAFEEHVTMEAVGAMLAEMKACIDVDQSAEALFLCSCRSEVGLSKLPPPADVEAHCSEVVAANMAVSALSEREQEQSRVVTGASDVPVSAGVIFSLVVPCMLPAMEAGDRAQVEMEGCFCFAHEVINRLWQPWATNAEMLAALNTVVQDMRKTGRCRPK